MEKRLRISLEGGSLGIYFSLKLQKMRTIKKERCLTCPLMSRKTLFSIISLTSLRLWCSTVSILTCWEMNWLSSKLRKMAAWVFKSFQVSYCQTENRLTLNTASKTWRKPVNLAVGSSANRSFQNGLVIKKLTIGSSNSSEASISRVSKKLREKRWSEKSESKLKRKESLMKISLRLSTSISSLRSIEFCTRFNFQWQNRTRSIWNSSMDFWGIITDFILQKRTSLSPSWFSRVSTSHRMCSFLGMRRFKPSKKLSTRFRNWLNTLCPNKNLYKNWFSIRSLTRSETFQWDLKRIDMSRKKPLNRL